MTARRWYGVAGGVGLLALATGALRAGAILDHGGYDVVGPSSTVPGHLDITLARNRWAANCLPIRFSINSTRDPIPNPNGAPQLTLAQASVAAQRAMATWSSLPASYIDMRLEGATANTGPTGLDFVNEIALFDDEPIEGAAAYSRSYYIPVDADVPDGLDLDGDGDADFTTAIASCRDVDGDGDIELPAGSYTAGTVIDTDVVVETPVWTFADLGGVTLPPFGDGRIDLQGILTHEFGHSLGLSHSNLQDSHADGGTEAVMYPGTYNYDGFVSLRTLHPDDAAWASYWYPEGSAPSGPAALQKGDVPFSARYALISGEVKDATGRPIFGALPYAMTFDGQIVSSTVSGTMHFRKDPARSGFFLQAGGLAFPDGRYVLPVPRGVYKIGIEADDALPFSGLSGTFSQFLADYYYGQDLFVEEFWSGPFESGQEQSTAFAFPVVALSDKSGIDFVVEAATTLMATDADPTDAAEVTTSWLFVSTGTIAASRIPTERLLATAGGRDLLVKQAIFGLEPLTDNERVTLPDVMITTGVKRADGSVSIDLQHPLVRQKGFAVQGQELSPLHVPFAEALGAYATKVLPKTGRDLFVVAHFPDRADPRVTWLGVDVGNVLAFVHPTAPGTGINDSYISFDGGASYEPVIGDPYFGLVVGTK